MSWAKLDDRFWCHRKVRKAGLEAVGLFAIALSWCSDNGTGGAIPYDECLALSRRITLWTKLLEVGLLDDFTPEKGATIHHFGHYNDTPEVAAAKKAARVEKATKAAESRWLKDAPNDARKHPPSMDRNHARDMPRVRDPVPIPIPTRPDPTRSEERSETEIATASRDPYGIAPLGENPDAYPGSVTPQLELVPVAPKVSADQKTRTRKGTTKGPRPDIDPATLTSEQREAFNAIVGDPTLAPITTRPAELARDLVTTWGDRLDLPTVIRAGGMYARSAPRPYTDGARFLTNQCTFALDKPAMRSRRPPGHVAPRRLTQAEWDIEVAAGRRPKEPDPEVTARNRAIHEAKLAAIRAEREAGGIAPPLPPHAAFSEEDLAALAADGADDEDPDE